MPAADKRYCKEQTRQPHNSGHFLSWHWGFSFMTASLCSIKQHYLLETSSCEVSILLLYSMWHEHIPVSSFTSLLSFSQNHLSFCLDTYSTSSSFPDSKYYNTHYLDYLKHPAWRLSVWIISFQSLSTHFNTWTWETENLEQVRLYITLFELCKCYKSNTKYRLNEH